MFKVISIYIIYIYHLNKNLEVGFFTFLAGFWCYIVPTLTVTALLLYCTALYCTK